MGLVTCGNAATDIEYVTFSSGAKETQIGKSDIMAFDEAITITGWSITATTAPTGSPELVTIVAIDGTTYAETTIDTAVLPAGDMIASASLGGPHVLAHGDGLQAQITTANGSEQLSVIINYQ